MTNWVDSEELELFATNSGALYTELVTPILTSLRKKVLSGEYVKDRAYPLWERVAKAAVRGYKAEIDPMSEMTGATVRLTAMNLQSYYDDELYYEIEDLRP